MSEIQLMMSNDGRVLCAVHARREPEVAWERLATVVAADGEHACVQCGASVDEGQVYADFDEPDLWLARYDSALACGRHLPPAAREQLAALPAGTRKFSYVDEASGRARDWYAVPVVDQPGAETVLRCDQCAAPGKATLQERFWRIPFPQDWVAHVRPHIVAALLQEIRWHASESALWDEWLDAIDDDFQVQEDGTLRFSCNQGVFDADLVAAPGMGTWLRLLQWTPYRSATVRYRRELVSVPAPGGLSDPATIFRALLLQLAPMHFVGATSEEAPGPAGDALLKPEGRWDVHTAAGDLLAADVAVDEAIEWLTASIGEDGKVVASVPTMRAYTNVHVEDELGRPGWNRYREELTAYASASQ
ncbi:hypothetical protein [Tsukamurella columbiensis]|uniref:Uncharacterized protein n=1 Tax=Tsukamurella columbiensis TaxID=128509 RepID=A0ABX1LJ45_9ACTN|nr:hypothetical protein [Tsukamurella columbiensis]NMD58319.1 hypothetical protein [Tsukamurella columbiensis]